uniref:Uncharacterized protein n=1 Tax=Rangifer tarandus platyrhynchus TaxID=3082113 RepID=A0ACB0E5X0_RANTA|nr:unnamed protein product [Rangifer tarandus platyrhynchus]
MSQPGAGTPPASSSPAWPRPSTHAGWTCRGLQKPLSEKCSLGKRRMLAPPAFPAPTGKVGEGGPSSLRGSRAARCAPRVERAA